MEKTNIFITGMPGVGKTTLIKKIADILTDRPVTGFYTNEIRGRGRRVGFECTGFRGQKGLLSHIGCSSAWRVGKYGVDIAGFERFLSLIGFFEREDEIVIIDEIGKMECFSEVFTDLIVTILDSPRPCIATIAKKGTPFIEGLKKRDDTEIIEVTRQNRDSLAGIIARMVEEISIKSHD